MRSADALRDGIRRVNRAPVVLACVFALTLLTALPFSLIMRDSLSAHLGSSMAADRAALGVDHQWWTEFTAQAGPLGRTFATTIIGFAAVPGKSPLFSVRQRDEDRDGEDAVAVTPDDDVIAEQVVIRLFAPLFTRHALHAVVEGRRPAIDLI
ncbi:MAG: hypothetical protein ABIR92_11775, partial [Gemmatimonadaceae bacterium]